jgi:hypothetical protein
MKKKRGPRSKPSHTTVRDDFSAIIDLITDAKARGVFDRKRSARRAAKPTVANAPFTPIVAAANTEDHQLRALDAAAQREVPLPSEASVIGEPITAIAITYSGHPRAGLRVQGARRDRRIDVGLADVVFPAGSAGARFVTLYRAWLGLDERSSDASEDGKHRAARHQVTRDALTLGVPVELIVLSRTPRTLLCQLLGTQTQVTLRATARGAVPGAILTVSPTKLTPRARRADLVGDVLDMRADVVALGLSPLALRKRGEWDPKTASRGEPGEPIEAWLEPILARGRRPMFEMEQIVPNTDADDLDGDPIVEASERNADGDHAGAREVLMSLLARDLRCLDAHAHLGNFAFERDPLEAQRHYEVGLSIGAFSVGKRFDGLLPWALLDNRPFLRCLHGAGLCAWRLGQTREAAAIFRRMLWLNPTDNQGARFNLAALEAGKTWEELEGDA